MEGLVGGLRGRLLLVQQPLESSNLLLHVLVNLQVSCDDYIHLLHIVVDVAVLRILPLNVLNELTLFSDHVSHLF